MITIPLFKSNFLTIKGMNEKMIIGWLYAGAESGIFVWGPNCNFNIFIKTTPTYTYTHTFLLYTLFYLISYIYTHQTTTKRV